MKPARTMRLPRDARQFHQALLRWFAREGRDLPWRRTRDAYEVLVSEVMLQQTQVSTVLKGGYFTRFLRTFPDIEALAAADDAGLLKAWEGLGYYRRARMLRDTARAVMERHGGVMPHSLEELLALPGVGRYTAGALRAFAHGLSAVLVDGNIARVLARLFDYRDAVDVPVGQRALWKWAADLADDGCPREYHSAIMELGQLVCRPGVPDCLACPVAGYCMTRKPEMLPFKKRKMEITTRREHALWVRDAGGRVLLAQARGAQRTGLWRLPMRSEKEVDGLPVLVRMSHAITRYRVDVTVHGMSCDAPRFLLGAGEAWHAPKDLRGIAMAAPDRRVLNALLENENF